MKKLLLLPLVAILFFGCSKDTVQDGTPLTAKQDAVSQYVVGIGFYGTTYNPLGTANVNGGDMAMVSPGGSATVVAYPAYECEIAYWWQYSSQPPLSYSSPVPQRRKVHEGEVSFTATINSETWYEPVFKRVYANVLFSNMINPDEVENRSFLEYTDENGNQQTLYFLPYTGIGTALKVKTGTTAILRTDIIPGASATSNEIYAAVRVNGVVVDKFSSLDILQRDVVIGPVDDSTAGNGYYSIDLRAETTYFDENW